MLLISLLLAALPAPRNVERLVGGSRDTGIHRRFKVLLGGIASLTYGKRARITAVVVVAFAAFAVYEALQVKIGNPVEGSSLLWPAAEFNRAVSQINRNFPGVNTLEIVFEAKDPHSASRIVREADTILTMQRTQSIIERNANPPRATLSFADYLMEGNRLFSGGNPKWLPLDQSDRAVNAAASAVMLGSSPKAYSHVIDFEQQNGTVSLWYKDNTQDTIDTALAQANDAVNKVGIDHTKFRVRLGSGTIALQHAMNSVVARYQWAILGFLNAVILIGCSLAYRSVVAGLILLGPVNLANVVLVAAMHLMGVGLDINALLVASIGVGVGIDYGIYLLSRICEECHACQYDLGRTITAALTTTGQAIMFTASIMVVGILPWYFLSGLKFMADMGLLLVWLLLINMVLALVVLPLLVWIVNPSFLRRKDLFIGEGVDPSVFAAMEAV